MGMEFDIEKDSIWKRNSIPESNLISKRNQPQIIKKWMAPMGFGNRQIPKKLNHFLKDPIFSTHEKLVSIDFPMFGNIFSCPLKINGNWNMCVCFIVLGENKLKYISIAYYMKYTDLRKWFVAKHFFDLLFREAAGLQHIIWHNSKVQFSNNIFVFKCFWTFWFLRVLFQNTLDIYKSHKQLGVLNFFFWAFDPNRRF